MCLHVANVECAAVDLYVTLYLRAQTSEPTANRRPCVPNVGAIGVNRMIHKFCVVAGATVDINRANMHPWTNVTQNYDSEQTHHQPIF